MKTVTTRLYEAMFLVDSALASSDWDGVLKMIQEILRKAQTDVVSIRKWDDRRLAYDIGSKTRGTYILAYFRSDSQKVHEIERAVQLSEQLMRVLILRADHVTDEDMQKETPAMRAERGEPVVAELPRGREGSDDRRIGRAERPHEVEPIGPAYLDEPAVVDVEAEVEGAEEQGPKAEA